MGKRKQQREKLDELEQLQKEVKELRSINRSLEKEIKKSNKQYKPEFDSEVLLKEEVEDKRSKCPQCGKGHLISTELGPRKLVRCELCDYRLVNKLNNGKS
jgi:predicted  nucleic acid-binding Zn ribbon protein